MNRTITANAATIEPIESPAYFITLTQDEIQKYWDSQPELVVITHEDIERAAEIEPPAFVIQRESMHDLAYQMMVLINEDRRNNPVESRNARPLQWDERLAQVALRHSTDMRQRHFIAHENLDGESPFERIRKGGVRFRCAGENLASGFFSIQATEEAFMDEPRYEPNHRANILNPDFTHVGIGIVLNADGTLVVTQNFIGRA